MAIYPTSVFAGFSNLDRRDRLPWDPMSLFALTTIDDHTHCNGRSNRSAICDGEWIGITTHAIPSMPFLHVQASRGSIIENHNGDGVSWAVRELAMSIRIMSLNFSSFH